MVKDGNTNPKSQFPLAVATTPARIINTNVLDRHGNGPPRTTKKEITTHMKTYIKIALTLLACSGLYAATTKPPMSAMTVSCTGINTPGSITVRVTAGATGAPAGFSVQWIKQSDLDANGGAWPDDTSGLICAASFSGVPACSQYNLAPYGGINVKISDDLLDACGASNSCTTPLDCDTLYAFRVFAHGNSQYNRGPFSYGGPCSTAPCSSTTGCTLTQGYWKNHTDAWPVQSLYLGTVLYDSGDLEAVLLASPGNGAGANGLITLAHQLIAAKLNIAAGADPTALGTAITDADNLIGSLVIPPLGTGFLSTSSTSALVTTLDNWNNGVTGPGHCQ
jgi:hypothetical protein